MKAYCCALAGEPGVQERLVLSEGPSQAAEEYVKGIADVVFGHPEGWTTVEVLWADQRWVFRCNYKIETTATAIWLRAEGNGT